MDHRETAVRTEDGFLSGKWGDYGCLLYLGWPVTRSYVLFLCSGGSCWCWTGCIYKQIWETIKRTYKAYAVLDATLYLDGERSDIYTYYALYGMSPRVVWELGKWRIATNMDSTIGYLFSWQRECLCATLDQHACRSQNQRRGYSG